MYATSGSTLVSSTYTRMSNWEMLISSSKQHVKRFLFHLESVDEEGSPDVLLDADDAALADAGRRRARIHLTDDVHASQDLRNKL